jgi:predicted  nucleic acid-binding Zn-ribbon protein
MFRCGFCGYIHEGEDAPEKCPKCGHTKEQYAKIADTEAELIEKSRYTNDLHIKLIKLMEKALDIADMGIEDDLDPPCVAIFRNVKTQCEIISQSSRTEIRGHVMKGKWQ